MSMRSKLAQRIDRVADVDDLRRRALDALREGRFDLAEELLEGGDVDLATLVESLRVYQAELEIQNEELIAAQQASAQSLERFTGFFQSLPVAELVVDPRGLVIEANPEARDLLGLGDIRAHQYFFIRFIDPEDRPGVISVWGQLDQHESLVLPEQRFYTRGGDGIIADLHIARLPAMAHEDHQFVCALIDRTEAVAQRVALEDAKGRLQQSEERYRVLAQFSPDWEYWVGPQGQFNYVSPACLSITGYAAEAFMADSQLLERLIHPDDHHRCMAHFHASAESEHDDDRVLYFRIRTRDGSERWLEHICQAVHGADGTYLGRRGVNRDVTVRTLAEQALRRSESFLAETGRIARVGGWELDLPSKALRWTAVTRELHEVPPDYQPRLDSALDFYPPEDRQRIEQAVQRAVDEARDYSLELGLITAKGRKIQVRATGRAVVEDGQVVALRGAFQDITSRVQADRALRESETRYRALFESAGEGLALLQDGRFISCNGAALHMLGHQDAAAVIGKRPRDLSPQTLPDGRDTAAIEEALLARVMDEGSQRFEWTHLRADGTPVDLEVTLIRVALANGPALFAAWHDLTGERAARERERRAQAVFDNTSEGIVVTDREQRILAVNPAFSEITGYREDEVLGETPRVLKSGRHDEAFYQGMWAELSATGEWRGEIWNRRKNGEIYPQLATISAVPDAAGEVASWVGVFSDISQIKRSEDALYHLAHHDALTGLPNRVLLRGSVEQSIRRARRSGSLLAMLFLDLDLFKHVNDTLGHPVGDALLKAVADAMSRRLRAADSIARIGGDEFVVLMEDIGGPHTAAKLARRLLDVFATPFKAMDRDLYITASIGISMYPFDGQDMDTLLSRADVAMYQAKDHGRNNYRFFEPEMTAGAAERLRLETALRGALDRGELRLAYQPQITLVDGVMHGAEALLRWHHPQLGDVSPGRFIPLAEEIGLIVELGGWVLRTACRQIAAWDANGFLVPRIAVNLSVQQIERRDLVDIVCGILADTGVEADRLELEVTESMLMRHADQVIANLTALRDLGITLAVDDFGSGFSSLAYLKRLPVHRLKIDKAFIDHIGSNPNDDAILRAIVAVGKGLGLTVLAEGVETEAQAEILRHEGCHEAQGYLFGRPVGPAELVERGSKLF